MGTKDAAAGFPIEPMLAKLATELPAGDGWLFEPKWDGFRAIVFRDRDRFYIQSRDLKPLDRYFPELEAAFRSSLPARCVVDGEIVIATERGLDFDALQMRLHPAASRVKKLAAETPASFVAFDLLAGDGGDLRSRPQAERRLLLEKALERASGSLHLTPCRRERSVAEEWFHRFEGAGLDGVIAKHESTTYQPGKRVMIKVKHARRGLRGGGLPLAQTGAGNTGRLAAERGAAPLKADGEAGVIPSPPPQSCGLLPSCPASPAGRSVQNAPSFSARGRDPPRDRSRSGSEAWPNGGLSWRNLRRSRGGVGPRRRHARPVAGRAAPYDSTAAEIR